ncbi:MAG: CRTAC1 family protein [Thermoanaerobaculia bacterium]
MRVVARILFGLLILAAAGAAVSNALFRGESSRRTSVTGSLFRDVTKRSGVSFQFRGDFLDAKLIPTMGGGVAAADYDGDGWVDLFFVTQIAHSKLGVRRGAEDLATCGKLYRNRGDGTFRDATEESGIRACGWGISAMWADLDSDGFPDLVVGNAGGNTLWRNRGDGTFEQVRASGLENGKMTIGLAAADFDGDGIPDVYVGNYLDTDPLRESKSGFSVKTPDEYPGQDNALYRGTGGLRFEDATMVSGTADPGSKTICAAALDYDGDGRPDLYVANDQWRNTLFHNEGGGRFRDVSEETGTGYPPEGPTAFGRRTRSGMGLVAEDLDGDGRPDLYVSNYAGEPNTLYRNVEGQLFEESDRAAFGAEHDPTLPLSKWGVVALDYDNDGRDDLAVSSGQILSRFWTVVGTWVNPQARKFGIGEKSYAQRQFLFRNDSRPGEMKFEDVSAVSGDLGRLCIVGRGLAAADFDGDGKLDLVYNPIDRPAILLRNEAPAGNAVEILPIAGADRRTVLGSVVTVGTRVKQFFVQPSYASGSWLPLHFGIGTATSAHATVKWPDGSVQDLGEVKPGAWKIKKGGALEPLRRGR